MLKWRERREKERKFPLSLAFFRLGVLMREKKRNGEKTNPHFLSVSFSPNWEEIERKKSGD